MSTRQSNRLKAQPKVEDDDSKYVASSDDNSDEDVAGPSSSKAGSKRKRKSARESTSVAEKGKSTATPSTTLLGVKDDSGRPTKKFRGKRGFLQQIADMPLELLFEIFGKLDPIDVLYLSRTTKSLRAILMHKSAADIWKASLENIADLPPAPEGVAEPQWVDLLFGKNCHVCGRTTSYATQTYAWEARLRGCSKCVLGEFTLIRPQWSEYLPTFQLSGSARRSERAVRYHVKGAQQLEESYKALKTPEERTAWFTEQAAVKLDLSEHARLCHRWLISQRDARSDALEEVRQARKNAMRQKIESMGYNPILVGLTFEEPSFWAAGCVVSLLKKDISDRAWAATEGAFTELMEGFKARLAKQQRDKNVRRRFDSFIEAYQQFVSTQPLNEALLTAADLLQVPGVKEIVLAEPIEDDIEMTDLEELVISKIPEYQAEWLKATKAKIVELVKADVTLPTMGLTKEAVDESTLDLAVALFRCNLCYNNNDGITGTNLPFHVCTREARHRTYVESNVDEDMKTFINHTRQIPWNLPNCFIVSGRAARAADIIKTKLKIDPATLTAKALDELDPIFEHVSGNPGRAMYSWRGLAARAVHALPDFTTVVLVEDEELKSSVRDRLDEALRKARAELHSGDYIHCMRCRKFKAPNSARIRHHLKDVHGVENITDEDIWVHPDEGGSGRHAITYYKYPGVTVI